MSSFKDYAIVFFMAVILFSIWRQIAAIPNLLNLPFKPYFNIVFYLMGWLAGHIASYFFCIGIIKKIKL